MKQSNETKQYFLFVNFDKKLIGIRENKLEWEVGDYTVVNENTGNVMVYALLNLTENGLFVVRKLFKKIYLECKRNEFEESLNLVVESLQKLTSDESRCQKIREHLEAEDAYKRMKVQEKQVLRATESCCRIPAEADK